MADLKEITARLADIGRVKPSDAARQKVKEALGSKWEGVQAAAAKTLARWGDRASVTMLREFLVQTYGRGHGLAIRGVAVHCLAQCVSEEDADWVLDEYFARPGKVGKHELLPLAAALPSSCARSRLLKEARSSDRERRQAAMKAIAHMDFPDKVQLLTLFVADADKNIRNAARINLLAHGVTIRG